MDTDTDGRTAGGMLADAARFVAGDRFLLALWLVATLGLGGLSQWSIHPLTGREWVLLGLDLLFVVVALGALRRLLHPGPGVWGVWAEYFRLGSLVCFAGSLFEPFFTSQMIGGVDARWYGYVMADALEQARAGVFPVLIGQGEYMYNGAIHPYLTAPYYTNCGILLDHLTGRAFSPLAIQHLVVIATAILGAVVSYTCAALLLPRQRGIAWALAALYVSAPIFGPYVAESEMYMTFTSFAWLPLAVYGNIRIIQKDDRAGWVCLAAGLALVWFCHAPVASWTSFFTVGVQGLRLVVRAPDWGSWRRAFLAALLFGALALGYFVPANAVLLNGSTNSLTFKVYALSAAVGAGCTLRWLLDGRLLWLGGTAAGAAGLAWARPQHAVLLGLVVAGGAGLRVLARRVPRLDWRRRLPECVVTLLLLAGILVNLFYPEPNSTLRYIYHRAAEYTHQQLFPGIFLPITPDAIMLADLQPGYSALGLLLLGGVVAAISTNRALSVVSIAGVLLVAMLAPVPGLTPLIYSLVPDALYSFSLGLWLRFFPLLANLMFFAGVLALGSLAEGRRPWLRHGLIWAFLTAGFYWNYLEAAKPMERVRRAMNDPEGTSAFYRTENARLYYAYDQLARPQYITEGVLDHHLQNRLLSVQDQSLLPDPLLSAPWERAETLKPTPNPASPIHFRLQPDLHLAPGTRLMLRFEFFDRPYDGYLDFGGGWNRRVYYLPAAGNSEKSFGVAPSRPKVLAFWNNGSEDLNLPWNFVADKPPAPGTPLGDFARIHFHVYRPEDLQIKVSGLLPYRAEVTLAAPAFLETSRVFIPGYEATLNGRPAPVEVSPDHLVMLRLGAGVNRVELAYRGTWLMKSAMALSAMAWIGLLGCVLVRRFRTPPAEAT